MTTVTISSKYQVVIPKDARRALNLRPGQRVEVLVYNGRLEFVPAQNLREARGFLKGLATDVPREKDRV